MPLNWAGPDGLPHGISMASPVSTVKSQGVPQGPFFWYVIDNNYIHNVIKFVLCMKAWVRLRRETTPPPHPPEVVQVLWGSEGSVFFFDRMFHIVYLQYIYNSPQMIQVQHPGLGSCRWDITDRLSQGTYIVSFHGKLVGCLWSSGCWCACQDFSRFIHHAVLGRDFKNGKHYNV